MQVAAQHERPWGWELFGVSNLHGGCSFDIRILGLALPGHRLAPVRR